LIASLFLTLSPVHSKLSHYQLPDIQMVFFQMLSFYFIWLIYKKGHAKYYILAGLFAGFSMATKYGGQILFLPLFLAHVFHLLDNKQPVKNIFLSYKLVLSVVFFLGGFLIACPYAVLDYSTFWKDFRWQSQHLYKVGHFGGSTAQPAWLFYLLYGFKENIGKFSQYLVFGGVIYGLIKHKKKEMILLSTPLLLFFIIGTWKTKAVRYFLPLTPFFILIASYFLDIILTKIDSCFSKFRSWFSLLLKKKGVLSCIIIIFFIFSPALKIVRFDYALTQKDTRTVAKEWIKKNIPKGATIATEMYGPPIFGEGYEIVYRHSLGDQVNLEYLSSRKVDYIIISDITYERFTRFPKEFPKQADFYNFLEKKASLIKIFKPKWDEYLIDLHNPTIKIFRLSECSLFPCNFNQYAQKIILTRSKRKRWMLESTITSEGFVECNEKIKNPYIRIVSPEGKNIAKLIVYKGELQFPHDFSYSKSMYFPFLPVGSNIFIGYEFSFKQNTSTAKANRTFKKEYRIKEKIDQNSIQNNYLKFIFLYTISPKKHGDDYSQIITLTKLGIQWRLFSHIFVNKLQEKGNYIFNPFVSVTDLDGNEIIKFIIFKGKLSSTELHKRAQIKKSMILSSLPKDFKINAGYDYYYNAQHKNLSGGPEKIEIKTLTILKD